MISLRVRSATDISKSIEAFGRQVIPASNRALNQAVEINVRGASQRIVPISDPNRYAPKGSHSGYVRQTSGTLRKSYYQTAKINGNKAVFEAGYSAPYASNVHKMDQNKTHWSRPGSRAKYLEEPYRQNKDKVIPDMVDIVMAEVRL